MPTPNVDPATEYLSILTSKVNQHFSSLADHVDLGLATSDSVTNHVTDTEAAHAASAISVTDAGYSTAQAAITAALAATGSGTATTADAVSVQDVGGFYTSTDVEDVLAEIGPQLAVGTHNLDSHSDVDLTTTAPVAGELLRWNGTNWVSTPNIYHPAPHFTATIAVGTIPGRSIIQEDGFHFRQVQAQLTPASTSGAVTVEIRYGDGATNTSTSAGSITVAQGAYRATNLGIAGSNIILDSGDFIIANVTAAGTGAANLTLAYRGYIL